MYEGCTVFAVRKAERERERKKERGGGRERKRETQAQCIVRSPQSTVYNVHNTHCAQSTVYNVHNTHCALLRPAWTSSIRTVRY